MTQQRRSAALAGAAFAVLMFAVYATAQLVTAPGGVVDPVSWLAVVAASALGGAVFWWSASRVRIGFWAYAFIGAVAALGSAAGFAIVTASFYAGDSYGWAGSVLVTTIGLTMLGVPALGAVIGLAIRGAVAIGQRLQRSPVSS